ncbi:MAG: carboxy-S-adenosyl-L-methionine synthase CmoA [Gammaproteobacteria bacterium]|jgi:tRNA (cmo5U34)-methyltransferase|nr:carboxy-S-adenosyl-L-methionine synthase CmoA [Gammaproteobacteria bacterium]
MSSTKDNIFLYDDALVDFVFDDNVANVFTDMVNRSVPGYALSVRMISVLAEQYARSNTRLYDLGCSLGAVSFLLQQLKLKNCSIVAVDNSPAMIKRCEESLALNQAVEKLPVALRCEDIQQTEISNASVVVLNFTLQFIAPEKRDSIIKNIYEALVPGGILIISEKIIFTEDEKNKLFIELYHQFKKANGYSDLEISRKRSALENVLIPETIEQHNKRITVAGFTSFDPWFQCFNFASMFAVK